MAKNYAKKSQKRMLIITVVACIVVAVLAGVVFMTNYLNTSPIFEDNDFAIALADALDVHARDLDEDLLSKYEAFVVTCEVNEDETGYEAAVILGDSVYADDMINNFHEASVDVDEEEKAEDEDEDSKDESSEDEINLDDHRVVVYYDFDSAKDVALFNNLRVLDMSGIKLRNYYTTWYYYYQYGYLGKIPASNKVNDVTSLKNFSDLGSPEKLR